MLPGRSGPHIRAAGARRCCGTCRPTAGCPRPSTTCPARAAARRRRAGPSRWPRGAKTSAAGCAADRCPPGSASPPGAPRYSSCPSRRPRPPAAAGPSRRPRRARRRRAARDSGRRTDRRARRAGKRAWRWRRTWRLRIDAQLYICPVSLCKRRYQRSKNASAGTAGPLRLPLQQGLFRYPQKLCIRLWKNTLLTCQNQAGMRVPTICPLRGQNSTFTKSMSYQVK